VVGTNSRIRQILKNLMTNTVRSNPACYGLIMPDTQERDESETASGIVHERGPDQRSFAESMVEVRRAFGKDVMRQVREMVALAVAEGSITPAEYYAWGLYDTRLSDAERLSFAGFKAMRKIWKACNFEEDWQGLVWDKIAFYAMMQGFGFPVPETIFVYHRTRSIGTLPVAGTPDAFAGLLRKCRTYPLFFKPNGSYQSLGSAAARSFDKKNDKLIMADGKAVDLASFVDSVDRYAQDGYLAQRWLRPHPSLQAICGDNLSTVRALVILTGEGPKLLNAAWKLPSPNNIADNYWRPGNMMAAVDPATGQAIRLVSGSGIDLQVSEVEPATSRPVHQMQVPNWAHVKELALSATDALSHLRLIGWDIGLTDKGPVIVEANQTPDFALHQFAEGRGMLTEVLVSFVKYCKAENRRLTAERRRRNRRLAAAEFAQVRAHARLRKL